MLSNNNQKVIRRMAGRSLKSNRGRTAILLLAIVLSVFMLFSVFTVGITYYKMFQVQNIRMSGAKFDAIMYGLTDAQREKCETDPDIVKTGICAVAGAIESTEYDDTVSVGLMWADEIYWREMKAPARKWMKGTYPRAEREILVTEKALEACGTPDLTIGDTLTAQYIDGSGQKKTGEFKISGIWAGYGDQKVFYVSEAFYRQCGYQLSDAASGRYHIDFKQKFMTEKAQEDFIESLDLGKQQRLFYTVEMGESIPLFLGLCGIALVTCFCAYLLIYNILYLSVSGNVRYYGLLQTIGMTGSQIRGLLRRQMLLLGSGGILAGLALGSGVSFVLIPSVVRFLGVREEAGKIQIAFHPAVFALTILLAAITIWIGSRKPARMAEAISPIEALGYRPSGGRKSSRKTAKGKLLWRMALEQLKKDKKKSVVITLSLAAGLSVFLCLITLIQSQGPRTFVSTYMDVDMTIENDTMKKEDHKEWRDILDGQFLGAIRSNSKVQEMHPIVVSEIMIPWEPEVADRWMREVYATWMSVPYEEDVEEYKAHPENFGTFLVGIDETDFDQMQQGLEKKIDKKEFLEGKTCVLYRDQLDFTAEDFAKEKITCAEYGNGENTRSFEIAGLTDEDYYTGPMLGIPPAVIVSQKAVEQWNLSPFVSKVSIQYQESYDEAAEQAMVGLMDGSPDARDFSYVSKIEEAKNVKEAQGNMMEVGIGIAAILALIGILNYVNTVIGNIQSRQVELAVLESIGMTDRQRNRLLMLEGAFFAGLSICLTGTLGLAVTYGVYQSMNYMGAPFAVPILPVAAVAVLILIICMAVPVAAGKWMERRGSVVERIKGVE
ncbi:ABC transporter permease [Lachnospiraceae bacterium KGMB03038]|nr:ABC transporter permease [Lachnospiraceae bacterium KGMB03038]